MLRPRHGVIVLRTLLWRDDAREPGDLGPSAPVSDRELQLAELLLSELTGVEMQQMEGVYRHTLEQLVAAKSVGSEVPELPTPQPAVDLMAAPERSVRTARRSRSRPVRPAPRQWKPSMPGGPISTVATPGAGGQASSLPVGKVDIPVRCTPDVAVRSTGHGRSRGGHRSRRGSWCRR
ncbi:hypothetical protein Sliba_00590 [Streptomyces nigrescens]|uniref:Uncharacterized protein n=1 Tax=Streptomyces nigrescens TaxID=1920 RepID=A0A640TBD9_STRNI|nr:hypothetical protein Sliba_00590 [Streptomyces libani subsp. libani]GGW04544.1 hypothetical protein GCM10010500_66830 [Streptomyces libani subsp. libani]